MVVLVGRDAGVREASDAALLEAEDGGALGWVAGNELQNMFLEDAQRPQQHLGSLWVLPRCQLVTLDHCYCLQQTRTHTSQTLGAIVHNMPEVAKASQDCNRRSARMHES